MEVWIGRDGARHGPYNESDVRDWLRAGTVSGDDLGWYEGLSDWQPLRTLFADAVPAAGTTPPPYTTAALPPATTLALEDYAGFWQRFAAWLIDYLILLIPSIVVFILSGATVAMAHYMAETQGGASPTVALPELAKAMRVPSLIMVVIGFVYYTLFEASPWQATPGKLALSLRVTSIEGQRPGLGRCLARNVIRLVNALTALIPFVFYIVAAWTPRKQGVHDLIAKTLVLNGRASQVKATGISDSRSPDRGSFNA